MTCTASFNFGSIRSFARLVGSKLESLEASAEQQAGGGRHESSVMAEEHSAERGREDCFCCVPVSKTVISA